MTMMRPSWLPANDSRLRWMPSWPRPAPTWPRSGGNGTTPVRPNAGAAAWQPGAGHGPGRVGLRGRNSRDGGGSGRAYVQDRPRDQGMDAAAAHRRSQWTGPQDRRDAGCRWQGDGGGQKIADFGDGRVNSTIGWQWKNAKNGKKSRIGELDEAAANLPVGERSKTKMNGGLERCK
ncbi:hypothetical protein E5352_09300 [Stenotrophomonas maltophilia]|uniref:Uncharacterized protein n=1 Tax=Stenotrophomonas maltophilia TaxID=40324 RepID=A0A4S2D0Y7_STEMA|nr:hypothetical protein E5352_09300 [Stenotrophomonas maltophilia]